MPGLVRASVATLLALAPAAACSASMRAGRVGEKPLKTADAEFAELCARAESSLGSCRDRPLVSAEPLRCSNARSCIDRFVRPEAVRPLMECLSEAECADDCFERVGATLDPLPEEARFSSGCRKAETGCRSFECDLTQYLASRVFTRDIWARAEACFIMPSCSDAAICVAGQLIERPRATMQCTTELARSVLAPPPRVAVELDAANGFAGARFGAGLKAFHGLEKTHPSIGSSEWHRAKNPVSYADASLEMSYEFEDGALIGILFDVENTAHCADVLRALQRDFGMPSSTEPAVSPGTAYKWSGRRTLLHFNVFESRCGGAVHAHQGPATTVGERAPPRKQ